MLRDRGCTVFEGVNRPANSEFERSLDLSDRALLTSVLAETQPSVVIHLAAISFAAHGNRAQIYQTNIIGSLNLMLAIQECGLQLGNFVAASSASVYGDVQIPVLDEDVVPQPVNDYGISKLAMEQVIRQWWTEFPITLLRLFNCTGVGQDQAFVIPKIVERFRERAANVSLGNTHTIREYNDVRFVAKAIAAVSALPEEYNVLNVCSGRGHSLHDVLSELTEITGHSLDVETDARFVRKNEIEKLIGRPARLVDRVGQIDPVPLRETLQWMVKGL